MRRGQDLADGAGRAGVGRDVQFEQRADADADAGRPPTPTPDNAVMLTIFLKHDQSRPLGELNAQLEKQGFYKAFPPEGVEVVSWYVMMGVGQVVTLRLPASRLREVNRIFETIGLGRLSHRVLCDLRLQGDRHRQSREGEVTAPARNPRAAPGRFAGCFYDDHHLISLRSKRSGGTRDAERRAGGRPPATSATSIAAIEVLTRRRADHQGARRPRQSEIARLSLQQGRADSLLCPSPRPPDHAAAPPRRRRLRCDRLGHRDLRRSRARLRDLVDRHGGKSLALYGGGGQGNHAGGAYATGFLRALGSRHVFNALSQEKTGDFWVNGHMFGSQTCHTAEDVHHCDLLFVIGANPWIAHGFPNARDHLNQIRKDPARKMIVIDPRRSETAEMADLHLAVRPGADAFLLGAILATLVRRDALDHEFITQHTTGFDEVKAALLRIPVAAMGRGRRHPARADRALRRHDRGREGDDRAGRARHPAGRQLDAELLSRKAADHADRQLWPERHQPAALLAAAAVGQLAEPAVRRDRDRSDRGPAAAERVSASRAERSSGPPARGLDRQLQPGQHRREHRGSREGARRARALRRGRRRHDRDGAAGALCAAGLLAI